MKNNQRLFLNIQKFADEKAETEEVKNENVESTAESVEEQQEDTKKAEKMYSRDELNKIVAAEKNKVREELTKENNEKEKVAKMDADEKLNYELQKEKEKNEQLENQLKAFNLKNEANTYATSKGLPLGYIEDFDYSKEDTNSIKEKIDKLVNLRSGDLKNYLNGKLKQSNPQAVPEKTEPEDPYIKGWKNYKKR